MISFLGISQSKKQIKSEIENFQKTLNSEYLNPKESPLRGENFKNFKEHPFFPINLDYRVNAKFTKTSNAETIEIPTSSGKSKFYKANGVAEFQIFGKNYQLTLYQSLALMQIPKYKDYLFVMFRDETNGKETYGGGKYMDLTIPEGDEIVIDFNKSYQPFCAYNAYDYHCPIVPEENKLPIRIEAGVKYEDIYFEH